MHGVYSKKYYIQTIGILDLLKIGEHISKDALVAAIEADKKRISEAEERISRVLNDSKYNYIEIVTGKEWEDLLKLHDRLSKIPSLESLLKDEYYSNILSMVEVLSKLDNSTPENLMIKAIITQMQSSPYYEFYCKYDRMKKTNASLYKDLNYVTNATAACKRLEEYCNPFSALISECKNKKRK